MPVQLVLYDDPTARGWQPFALTRPIGEMLFGTEKLRARAERVFGATCEGHLAGDGLLGFEEPGAPPCIALEGLGRDLPRLLVNSRLVVEPGAAEAAEAGLGTGRARGDRSRAADSAPSLLTSGGAVAGAALPAGCEMPQGLLDGDDPPPWPRIAVGGALLDAPWDLVAANGDRIRADADRFVDADLPPGVHRIGHGKVAVAPGAVVEPGVVIDATAGPVLLDAGVTVAGPARLSGPLHVGRSSQLLGGFFGNASIGPGCRVRGEVEATVMLGFANKAHDGFLGHALVGRWVNLGALTTNSDLKNSYGPVRIEIDGRAIDTGMLKVGCFLGDHARTGIGTLLTTGAVVGAGSNLFGGGLAPRWTPPFSWGGGGAWSDYDMDRFLGTAARVMARRDATLAPGMRRMFRRAFAASAPARRRHRAALLRRVHAAADAPGSPRTAPPRP